LIKTVEQEISTRGEEHIQNITDRVQEQLERSGAKTGFVLLFIMSSTSSLAIMEWEEGLLSDLPSMMEKIAPKEAEYEHEKAWHDGNGHSHMRASLLGASLSIPFNDGGLLLGTWQQIILVEFDVRPRKRRLVIQIHGE